MNTFDPNDRRRYAIDVVKEKYRRTVRLDLHPLTHRQACTFLTKLPRDRWRRNVLVEVSPV